MNSSLKRGNAAAYAPVPTSLDAHRRFFAVADALSASDQEWITLNDESMRVRITGEWFPRYLWSDDPSATMTWELLPPARACVIEIRYPGDPNLDHASVAQLRVQQNGMLLIEHTVNLRERTLQWVELGVVKLASEGPIQITLKARGGTGALVMFEPRLREIE